MVAIIIILALALLVVAGLLYAHRAVERADRTPVAERFPVLVESIVMGLFDGQATVTPVEGAPSKLTISSATKRNIAVRIGYSVGELRITLLHVFLNETFSHDFDTRELWDASEERQRQIAERFIKVARQKIEDHRRSSLF